MHSQRPRLWDSSSARDAESNSAKSTSNTRLSTAAPALRCHPRLTFGDGSSSPAKGPASAPSTRAAHFGVWKPWRRRDSAACSASRALGGVLGTDRSVKGRTRLARVPGWLSRKAPITSAQDAHLKDRGACYVVLRVGRVMYVC